MLNLADVRGLFIDMRPYTVTWHLRKQPTCDIHVSMLFHWQAELLAETQENVYERFLCGMMAKDKKQDEKVEQPEEDHEDDHGIWCLCSAVVACCFSIDLSYFSEVKCPL